MSSDKNIKLLKWALPVIIIVGAYALVQIMIAAKASAPKKPAAASAVLVEVATIALQPIQLTVQSQGTVKPKQQIEVVSEVAGTVLWVSPKLVNGGRVEQGELLLKIDPINYQVAVAEARASLAQAELNLADEQAEYKRGAAYGIENKVASASLRSRKLALVEAEHKASLERLRQAEQQLAKTQITAAFAAFITAKAVDVGQYVAVGKVLMNLQGAELAEIRLPISHSELAYLPQQLPTPVSLQAANQQQWQAQVVRVDAMLDEQTRVVNAVAQVARPYDLTPQPLNLGMFVKAQIQGLQLPEAVRLPLAALHGDEVYVVEQGRLQLRKVHVYRRESQHAIIDSGLNNGDQVVMTKLDLMIAGMAVDTRVNQALLSAPAGYSEGAD
ncbi:efflux RND transporter periplasmic adaptor subunit [Dasania sp. GY-MA-18]|uniref:Efflux RND transporter periplasmic adaptor subunit n=1 Tax=Dasania phycosphaerae TaxID=2950436 RepID=A0A9J6RME7_9GAMM|nr:MULTISPECIES: efflux RND transporter periplasmic adaptor subunit [Dasania]MCR8923259.1 efflux RND transporter periplasmic adaptor subunit [Dasania sp. GY-MA-18]MCZ0865691.1 efflux RND transporter periplasmic adaptor subunit [Dasania phycosphaerae]MCZ0869416.1 efflux RND transporter periplasmic adaptor subunit [Dasania phycosphaerae]